MEEKTQSSGYVKLWRQINENVFLQNDNNAFMVFVKLLTRVNRKGEWGGGRNQLAKLINISPGTLYSVLKRLQTQHLINIKSNKRYSVICICNWGKYQEQLNSKVSNDSAMTQHSYKNKKYINFQF